MKKLLVSSLVALSFAALAGCGTAEEAVEAEPASEVVTEDVASEETTVAEEATETATTAEGAMSKEDLVEYGYIGYGDKISNTMIAFQEGFEGTTTEELGVSDVFHYCQPAMGYVQKDINGDGVDELLFGETFEDGLTTFYNIYALDPATANVVTVCNGGERDTFAVLENGVIVEQGSNSADDSFTKYYTLEGCTLTECECPADYVEAVFELSAFSDTEQ